MRHDNESTVDYMRRIVQNLNHEPEYLLDELPTIQAAVDYFELWHVYDADFWSGVVEAISQGADPAPARRFIRKHRAHFFNGDITNALKIRKAQAA